MQQNPGSALAPVIGVVLLVTGCAAVPPGDSGAASRDGPTVDVLLSSGETVLGQALSYPHPGPARVTASIVHLEAGEATGWHAHEVPLFGYMLEGELTVDYGPHGVRVYRTGDSLLEAIDAAHNGTNTGDRPVRILAVYIGAEDRSDSTPAEPPGP